jgi:hypothetical protein
MGSNSTKAGGCFLTVCILGGFAVGLAIRDPMKGVLIGTGIGTLLALGLWLIDRRKAG